MNVPDAANSKRRGLRFSLRALLVVITAACLLGGWFASWHHGAYRQRAAVAKIRDFGFIQRYDIDARELMVKMRSWRWLSKYLTEDHFRTVVGIQGGFAKPVRPLTDSDLPLLAEFPRLRHITLYETAVTTDGLKFFQSLKHLERLYVQNRNGPVPGDGEGLTDLARCKSLSSLSLGTVSLPRDGLAFLREMPQLKSLDLTAMELNAADVEHLASLGDLRSLGLYEMPRPPGGLAFLRSFEPLQELKIPDMQLMPDDFAHISSLEHLWSFKLSSNQRPAAGLGFLRTLRELQWLYLEGLKLDDDDIRHIATLKNLIALHLEDASFDVRGLRDLAALQSINKLILVGTNVDDADLEYLSQIRSLTELDLHRTSVSDEAIGAFRSAQPGCTVYHESLPDPRNISW